MPRIEATVYLTDGLRIILMRAKATPQYTLRLQSKTCGMIATRIFKQKRTFTMTINKQVVLRCFGLFGLLATIYFFTYSGTEISTDELKLFDGAHSVFQDG